MVCSQHEKSLKAMNIVILMGSGVCIIVGVIVFAVELFNAFDEIFANVDVASVADDKLGYSFFLCAVAGGLCLFVCVPLFIMDYRAAATQTTQQLPVQYSRQERSVVTSIDQPMQPLPVQYSNQSRVIVTSTNQPAQPVPVHYSNQVIQTRNYQPHGNMPTYAQDRPVYYVTRHPSFERMPSHGVW
ncbi:uncharacterized protein LOC128557427 [Mercenaria mercenaria]|uniref:uncharacterized protein LOC128557427 n=1 Tax=Mercenaria mercenaria TaxID=6596 RepID=UPI00234E4E92|nr:uncharacterized protein LOC128557427 [Mercenaria mercenaria]